MGADIVFNPVYLLQNKVLGNAFHVAVKSAKNELIPGMDSDDISAATRFEREAACFNCDSELDIVGGDIVEFIDKFSGAQAGRDETAIQEKIEIRYPPFSMAMSVYGKDNPKWFDIALASVVNQTVQPDEIVLVIDGSIPNGIQHVINKYAEIFAGQGTHLEVVRFEKNQGLGNALRAAIDKCSNELIARMDSDDICVEDRFEQQLKYMTEHTETDIVGGNIAEFIDEPSNVVAYRNVPESDDGIKEYMKRRCSFNHMSVMYKKSAVISAGGYINLYWNEDYYLWIRMMKQGCIMANLGITLVNVRVGKDMYKRRGGKKYFKSERFLQTYMKDNKMINFSTYLMNCTKRLIVQVLLPNNIRGWVFRKFARD